MTENDFILLLQIYSHRQLTEEEIVEQLSITKSQLVYRISRINDWLTRNDLQGIERTSKKLYFNKELSEFIEKLDFSNLPISHLDQESRLALIFIIIAISHEALSLNHLAQYASVSKNTILMDIKVIKEDLKNFDSNLEYSRSKGYSLKGREFDIRRFAEYYIDKLQNPHVIINEIAIVEPRIEILIDNYQNLIFHVENELRVRYSDRAIESAPLYFYLIDQRISKGKYVNPEDEGITKITDSDEYTVIKRLGDLYFYSKIPETEFYFLSLYFLSINKMEKEDSFYSLKKNELTEAIEESIKLFESTSAITIKDKNSLVEKLGIHLSAAFYRYKYSIRSPYPISISSQMRADLEEIYYFVSRSIYPIEAVMEIELPDDEIFFIASYIGGHIRANSKLDSFPEGHLTAIVICENGLVYSNILMNSLKQMFKEIRFVGVMSIREFYKNQEMTKAIDIVFSSTYISTDRNLVVVNSFNTEEESRVIKEVNEIMKSKGVYGADVVSDVMALIPNELPGTARSQIKTELEKYFKVEKENEDIDLEKVENFAEKLSQDRFMVNQTHVRWKEIINILGHQFIDEEVMKIEDLNRMHEVYPEPMLEILLGGTILLPHIRVESVKGFHIRMMYLEQPIKLQEIEIKMVLMLIAGDDESHVKTVYQLHQLSMSPEIIDIMEMDVKENIRLKIIDTVKHNDERGN